jgi:hypothetical protein
MGKKKAGGKKAGGGKKKKGPEFYTGEEDLSPFGFKLRDIVCTPIGLKGTVIGVKYDPPGPENKDSAQIWVEYADGKRCPLEPKLHSGFIGQAAGYRRVSEADHIWRDVEIVQAKIQVSGVGVACACVWAPSTHPLDSPVRRAHSVR